MVSPRRLLRELPRAETEGRRVTNRWVDNSNNESGFIVQRSNGENGAWLNIGMAQANELTFIDDTAMPGNDYRYPVFSVSGDSASFLSASVPAQIELLRASSSTTRHTER